MSPEFSIGNSFSNSQNECKTPYTPCDVIKYTEYPYDRGKPNSEHLFKTRAHRTLRYEEYPYDRGKTKVQIPQAFNAHVPTITNNDTKVNKSNIHEFDGVDLPKEDDTEVVADTGASSAVRHKVKRMIFENKLNRIIGVGGISQDVRKTQNGEFITSHGPELAPVGRAAILTNRSFLWIGNDPQPFAGVLPESSKNQIRQLAERDLKKLKVKNWLPMIERKDADELYKDLAVAHRGQHAQAIAAPALISSSDPSEKTASSPVVSEKVKRRVWLFDLNNLPPDIRKLSKLISNAGCKFTHAVVCTNPNVFQDGSGLHLHNEERKPVGTTQAGGAVHGSTRLTALFVDEILQEIIYDTVVPGDAHGNLPLTAQPDISITLLANDFSPDAEVKSDHSSPEFCAFVANQIESKSDDGVDDDEKIIDGVRHLSLISEVDRVVEELMSIVTIEQNEVQKQSDAVKKLSAPDKRLRFSPDESKSLCKFLPQEVDDCDKFWQTAASEFKNEFGYDRSWLSLRSHFRKVLKPKWKVMKAKVKDFVPIKIVPKNDDEQEDAEEIEFVPQGRNAYCASCKLKLVEDPSRGEWMCNRCGVVAYKNGIDTGENKVNFPTTIRADAGIEGDVSFAVRGPIRVETKCKLHYPKSATCPICQSASLQDSHRRRAHKVVRLGTLAIDLAFNQDQIVLVIVNASNQVSEDDDTIPAKTVHCVPLGSKKESEVRLAFCRALLELEFLFDVREIRRVHSDNGGEWAGLREDLLTKHFILPTSTQPYDSQSNGCVESTIGLLKSIARSSLHESGLDHAFWPLAMTHAAYVVTLTHHGDVEGRLSLKDVQPFGSLINVGRGKKAYKKIPSHRPRGRYGLYMHPLVGITRVLMLEPPEKAPDLSDKDLNFKAAYLDDVLTLSPVLKDGKHIFPIIETSVLQHASGGRHILKCHSCGKYRNVTTTQLYSLELLQDGFTCDKLPGIQCVSDGAIVPNLRKGPTPALLRQQNAIGRKQAYVGQPCNEMILAAFETKIDDRDKVENIPIFNLRDKDFLGDFGDANSAFVYREIGFSNGPALIGQDRFDTCVSKEINKYTNDDAIGLPAGVVTLPEDALIFDTNCLFGMKQSELSFEEQLEKARLVVLGHLGRNKHGKVVFRSKKSSEDFWCATAPLSSLRAVTSTAALKGFELSSIDLSQAYLQSLYGSTKTYIRFDPQIYKYLPDKIKDEIQRIRATGIKDIVFPVIGSLYGLCRAGFDFSHSFKRSLLETGWKATEQDPAVYYKDVRGVRVLLLTYVDDLLLAAPPGWSTEIWKEILRGPTNEMKSGVNRWEAGDPVVVTETESVRFLGSEITGSPASGYRIDQSNYAQSIISDFEQRAGVEIRAVKYQPEHPETHEEIVFPDEKTDEDAADIDKLHIPLAFYVKQKDFTNPEVRAHSTVGALMYLSRGTRLDITQATQRCAEMIHRWDENAEKYLRGLLGYIKTTSCCVEYKRPRGALKTIRDITFSDSNYRAPQSRSGSVYAVKIVTDDEEVLHIIDWRCAKQRWTALSSGHAELVAIVVSLKSSLVTRALCRCLADEKVNRYHICLSDASAVISAVRRGFSNKISSASRVVGVSLVWLCELARSGAVRFHLFSGKYNLADLLTKAIQGQNKELVKQYLTHRIASSLEEILKTNWISPIADYVPIIPIDVERTVQDIATGCQVCKICNQNTVLCVKCKVCRHCGCCCAPNIEQ